MTYAEIEQLTRREIDDEIKSIGITSHLYVEPWQILKYANEAEAEACIRARLLVDSTTDSICAIQTSPGISVYDYDPRIVSILRGKITGAVRPIKRVSFTVLDDYYPDWDVQTGEVEAFVTGLDKGKIRLFRQPTVASPLNLTVARLPLNPMVDDTSIPEIPEHLHAALVCWIKHKIFNNQDAELFDRNRADVHLQMFEQKFGQRTASPFDVFDAMQIPEFLPQRSGIHNNSSYDENYYF